MRYSVTEKESPPAPGRDRRTGNARGKGTLFAARTLTRIARKDRGIDLPVRLKNHGIAFPFGFSRDRSVLPPFTRPGAFARRHGRDLRACKILKANAHHRRRAAEDERCARSAGVARLSEFMSPRELQRRITNIVDRLFLARESKLCGDNETLTRAESVAGRVDARSARLNSLIRLSRRV